MKKLDVIKEYIIKNNITSMGGSYINNDYEYSIHASCFTNWSIYLNSIHTIIKSIKKSDTTYLIDIYTKKYQKIGNFKKGEELGEEIDLYYRDDKYINFPGQFIDKLKNKDFINNPYIHIPVEENIEKYYNFWIENFFKYPEYSDSIIKRLRIKDQRKLKLEKLNGININ